MEHWFALPLPVMAKLGLAIHEFDPLRYCSKVS